MGLDNKIRKSLNYSFLEGFFGSLTGGFVSEYITPYALFLKASLRQIGALTAIPFFVSSFAQLKSADIAERLKSRKRVLVIFVFIHTLMLLPVIFIPRYFRYQPVIWLIIFITLYTGFNTLSGPVNSALVAEYVPRQKRGSYFGWRSRVTTLTAICGSLFGGVILQIYKNNLVRGFTIIFTAAFISRLISWYFLTRLYEPPFKITQEAKFSLFDFIKNIRRSNFAKFTLFISGIHFCVNLAAPFFSVFMLKDLKFNYITYTLLVSTVPAVQMLTFGRWGRLSDRVGNLRIARFTALIISSIPLWWLLDHNPVYLFFIQMLSGFAWAGFNLCVSNFIYDAVTPQKRIRCIGYFNFFINLAIFLGGLLGGQLAVLVPNLFGYKLLSLFLLSSLLRFTVVFIFSKKIKEVRQTENMNTWKLISGVVGIRSI